MEIKIKRKKGRDFIKEIKRKTSKPAENIQGE